MLPVFSRFLLVTAVFSIAFGAGPSSSSQTPSPQSSPDASPMASPRRDLSGTYVGLLQYPEKGLYGEATLVITGNRFTFTTGSTTLTGHITTKTFSRRIEMVFDGQPPSSAATSISLLAVKEKEDIWLGSSPGGDRVHFYFGTERLLKRMGTGEAPAGVASDPTPRRADMRAAPRTRRAQPVGSASSAGPSSEGPEESTAGSAPPVGSSPAATPDSSFFSKLKGEASVVFNTPPSMKMEETKVIELLVSPSMSVEELTAKLSEPGESGTGSTPYADRMEAQLTGTGFTITPITPAIQPVEPGHITKWMWEIKPKDGGAQRLVLSLNAVLNDGKDRAMVETFRRDINIKVSWSQRASGFVGGLKDMQWLWAAIIVPIAGAIYGWWRKKQKARRRKKGSVREKKSSQP
ncbi:MAG: hypothetical protein H7Z16_07330 [Pyrinomonadaceae bacterium]|nr:hypothetical protein [Pyrinomonadaceae bacterium]